jgi:hypothetical protein
MAKLFASEMANHVADEACRIFASYGFAMEYDAQRYFRDARFWRLVEERRKCCGASSLTRWACEGNHRPARTAIVEGS